MPATYPPGYGPGELRYGLQPLQPYDYNAQSPDDRQLMGIMTLTSICAFLMAGGYVNAIPAATAVEADIAAISGVELSAEVRAGLLEALEVTPLEAAETQAAFGEYLGAAISAEEKALIEAGYAADLTTAEGIAQFEAAQPAVLKLNMMNVIRLAENDALAGSRYMSELAAYHALYGDRWTHGTIGNYFSSGPGGSGDSPGFPGFPGGGFPIYHDGPLNNGPGGHGTWACISIGDNNDVVCHWEF